MCAKARKLDGCHHDSSEDEGGTKEGDGAQDLADQEERKDGGADRLEREGEAGGLGGHVGLHLSLIHISEPTRPYRKSRMPSSA